MSTNVKSSSKNNRRRFSDHQVQSLETTFETESRPELRLKHHLANKLGLQPRQIAIWFQNKRARSKSKQIEEEYNTLKSSYDNLASQFEDLRRENQTLLIQAQRLRKMAEKSDGEENDDKNKITPKTSENPRFLLDNNSHELRMPSYSDLNIKNDYLEEDADVRNMAEIAEGSLASPENRRRFEPCNFLDNTCSSSQWWDF